MVRDSMVLFRSMTDALRRLEPLDFYFMMYVIIDYAMDDVEPEFNDTTLEALWLAFKPLIDANKRRYEAQVENGKKGGRPKKETIGFADKNPNKPNETQINPIKPNETQVKPYMRNEKCNMRNEKGEMINDTSSIDDKRKNKERNVALTDRMKEILSNDREFSLTGNEMDFYLI